METLTGVRALLAALGLSASALAAGVTWIVKVDGQVSTHTTSIEQLEEDVEPIKEKVTRMDERQQAIKEQLNRIEGFIRRE